MYDRSSTVLARQLRCLGASTCCGTETNLHLAVACCVVDDARALEERTELLVRFDIRLCTVSVEIAIWFCRYLQVNL